MCDFVLISQRMQIEKAFEEWANDKKVKKTPSEMLTFLNKTGMLNTVAIVEYLKQGGEKGE